MAIRGNPQAAAAKWQRNLAASTQSITDGVNAVTEAPGTKAAAQKQVWQQNVINAADKWAANTAAVSLADWKAAALAGVSRIASGASQKVGKVQAFQAEFYPHLQAVQQRLASMPRGSLDQNLARMVENARLNAQFRRSGR